MTALESIVLLVLPVSVGVYFLRHSSGLVASERFLVSKSLRDSRRYNEIRLYSYRIAGLCLIVLGATLAIVNLVR
jgi:hypothetical protein